MLSCSDDFTADANCFTLSSGSVNLPEKCEGRSSRWHWNEMWSGWDILSARGNASFTVDVIYAFPCNTYWRDSLDFTLHYFLPPTAGLHLLGIPISVVATDYLKYESQLYIAGNYQSFQQFSFGSSTFQLPTSYIPAIFQLLVWWQPTQNVAKNSTFTELDLPAIFQLGPCAGYNLFGRSSSFAAIHLKKIQFQQWTIQSLHLSVIYSQVLHQLVRQQIENIHYILDETKGAYF